jgi:hypothetical protein
VLQVFALLKQRMEPTAATEVMGEGAS